MKSPQRKFVVDADVAQAAGPDPRDYPWPEVSKHAHDVLSAIRESAQYVVLFDTTLYGEWSKHAGKTAKRWLANMVARRRVVRIGTLTTGWIDALIETLPTHDQSTALKDKHLVVLACAHGDQRLLSGDAKAREKFARLTEDARLANLHWAKPSAEVVLWLKNGAADERRYTLTGTDIET